MRFVNGRLLAETTLLELEETELGVIFPTSYLAVVRENDGAMLEPCAVRFVNPQTDAEEVISCNQLLPFQSNEEGCFTMAEANRELIPFLPLGVVVFGIEAGGYLFGFDFRRQIIGATEVPIVLLYDDNDPEYRIVTVAKSFDDLLARIELEHLSALQTPEAEGGINATIQPSPFGGCQEVFTNDLLQRCKQLTFRYGKPLSNKSSIELEEHEFGVEFPESYKAIVMKHDGASIEPAGVRFINPETGLGEVVECNSLIPFVPNDTGSQTMAETNRGLIQNLPFGLIVAGREAGGYLFGFDYSNQTEGTDVPIVLLHLDNHPEFAVIKVADSFDQFIARLEPSEEPGHLALD